MSSNTNDVMNFHLYSHTHHAPTSLEPVTFTLTDYTYTYHMPPALPY